MEFLSILSLIILFRILDSVELVRGAFASMLYFFTAILISHFWLLGTLITNFSRFLGYPPYMGFLTFLLFAFYESLFYLGFGAAYVLFRDRMNELVHSYIFVPSLFALIELLRGMGDLGFTGASLSDAFFKNEIALWIVSLVGKYGLIYLVVAGAEYLKRFRYRDLVLILGAIYLVFYIPKVVKNPVLNLEGQLLTLYQTSQDPVERYSVEPKVSLEKISDLEPKGILVTPEAFVSSLPVSKRVLDYLPEGAILGVVYKDERGYHNAAVYREGKNINIYDKVRLFPFAEMLPYPKVFSFLKFLKKLHYYTPGKSYKPMVVNGKSVGVLICFESYFEEGALTYANEGADFLLVISNDGWFKSKKALMQHFAKAVIRAAESGLWVVQVSNTGITGVVDGRGNIRVMLPPFTERAVHTYVGKPSPTLYSKYWKSVPFILIALLVVSVSFSRRRRVLKVWK